MDFSITWIILICITLYQVTQCQELHNTLDGPNRTKSRPSHEKRLIRYLMQEYKKYGVIGRPVENRTIQVKVTYQLQLFQVIDLDANKQILQTNCWPVLKWSDALLKWDPKDYGDITTVRIFPSEIWIPDIKLYNFADERLDERRNIRIVVYHTGDTLWMPQSLYKSTCEVEIGFFPFDTQLCNLQFGSWSYDLNQMDLLWGKVEDTETDFPYLEFGDYVPSNTWQTDGQENAEYYFSSPSTQIQSTKYYRNRTQIVGGKNVTRSYPVLCYKLRLRRNPGIYIIILVIPTILLSALTLVIFWVPPDSPTKMLLGVNLFVAFSLLLQNLSQCTPKASSSFPIIGIYFCLNMVMITLSTFIATMIVHLHFQGDRRGVVPWIIRKVLIDGIGRLLLVRHLIELPEHSKIGRKQFKRKISLTKQRSVKQLPNNNQKTSHDEQFDRRKKLQQHSRRRDRSRYGHHQQINQSNADLMSNTSQTSSANELSLSRSSSQSSSSSSISSTASSRSTSSSMSSRCGPPPSVPRSRQTSQSDSRRRSSQLLIDTESSLQMEKDIHQVRLYIQMYVHRQKIINRKGLVSKEWRSMALVLDRIFFVAYLATIAAVLVVTLINRDKAQMSSNHNMCAETN